MTEADRKEQILDAALRVFARHGFHKATIKQIAAEAGVKSPALIYWYFKDKRELLVAMAQRFLPFNAQALDPAQLALQPIDLVLPLMMKALARTFSDPQLMLLVRVFMHEAAINPDVASYFQEAQMSGVRFITALLDQQITLGRLRPHDTRAAARAIVGTMIAYIMGHSVFPWLWEEGPTVDEYVDQVVQMVVDGLRPREGNADDNHN